MNASFCLKSPPVFDKNIQSCVGEMAGRDPKVSNVCGCLVFCMVMPGCEAWDTLVFVLGTLRCALDVGVGVKVVFALVSLSVMRCFWVVFTGFLRDLRHGCGGLVGWHMVRLCWLTSSGCWSGGILVVSV